MPLETKNKMLGSSSQTVAQYTVESVLELKRLTKVIPEDSVFTYQNMVSGVKGSYIPR